MSQFTKRTTLELHGLDERGRPLQSKPETIPLWALLQHDDLVFPVTLICMLSLGLLPLLGAMGA